MATKLEKSLDLLPNTALAAALNGVCGEFHRPAPLLKGYAALKAVIHDLEGPSLLASCKHSIRICRVSRHTNNGRPYRSSFQADTL